MHATKEFCSLLTINHHPHNDNLEMSEQPSKSNGKSSPLPREGGDKRDTRNAGALARSTSFASATKGTALSSNSGDPQRPGLFNRTNSAAVMRMVNGEAEVGVELGSMRPLSPSPTSETGAKGQEGGPNVAVVRPRRGRFKGTAFNLANTIIGAGILSLPHCFVGDGLVGGALVVIGVAILAVGAASLLISSLDVCGAQSFGELGYLVWGDGGAVTVDVRFTYGSRAPLPRANSHH